ncbi:hypothetical protein MAPG_01568 [Magnaporthiopsis poae ATCC 64411]|uniref:chitinase n=1 Tax=Magnaporthiopsis poae (strain ATCC 64411 / 73-15) TaxID=644358 RepID=A0A0C4DP18_MAGP6|nr:hypothetical protein MAPG_01568 [Magnaporthiopsis poae ATCC 64411]
MHSSMEQAEIPHLHRGRVVKLEDTEADLTTVKNEPVTTEKNSTNTLIHPDIKLESIEGELAAAKGKPGTMEQGNKGTLNERDVVPKKNMLYFASWDIHIRNYQPRDIPVQNVTHIIYSFANVHPDGTVTSGGGNADTIARSPADPADPAVGIYAHGCVGQLAELKKSCRHLKVLLSIGGPACSPNFASAAGSAENRKRFARTASSLIWDWGLDGIDVDWEHPANAAEAENMLLLLAEVRARLGFYSKVMTTDYRLLLTMTVGAGRQHMGAMSAHLGRMAALVDAVGLKAYES